MLIHNNKSMAFQSHVMKCSINCFLTMAAVGTADGGGLRNDVSDVSALLCSVNTVTGWETVVLHTKLKGGEGGISGKATLLISHKSFLALFHLSLFPFHSRCLPNIINVLENTFLSAESQCGNQKAGLKHPHAAFCSSCLKIRLDYLCDFNTSSSLNDWAGRLLPSGCSWSSRRPSTLLSSCHNYYNQQ